MADSWRCEQRDIPTKTSAPKTQVIATVMGNADCTARSTFSFKIHLGLQAMPIRSFFLSPQAR